eukprot:gene16337-biopygen304
MGFDLAGLAVRQRIARFCQVGGMVMMAQRHPMAHGGARWREGLMSSDPGAGGVLTGGPPFAAARRMVAHRGARGGSPRTLGQGVYSPVDLLLPHLGAWWRKAHGGARWRVGDLPSDPWAWGVLTGGPPFAAARRMVAQGGTRAISPRTLGQGKGLVTWPAQSSDDVDPGDFYHNESLPGDNVENNRFTKDTQKCVSRREQTPHLCPTTGT